MGRESGVKVVGKIIAITDRIVLFFKHSDGRKCFFANEKILRKQKSSMIYIMPLFFLYMCI